MPIQDATSPKKSQARSRDKLNRLGDTLDAAQKAGDGIMTTATTRLIREYRKLARERALAAPLPKVTIKTTADYWEANKMDTEAFARYRALKTELDELQYNGCTWRQMADMQAELALAFRNWQHIYTKKNARAAAKATRIKQFSKAKRQRTELGSNLGSALLKSIREAGHV